MLKVLFWYVFSRDFFCCFFSVDRTIAFVAGFVTDRCNINTTIRPIVRF